MKRILVVDDQSLVRNVIRLILEQEGYECLEAENGHEAWTWLFEPLPIDLVVTDYQMPIMNGVQLIRKLQTVNRLNHLPIILMSGSLTPELKEEVREMGIDAMLTKPLDVPELMHEVTRLLTRKREIPDSSSIHQTASPPPFVIL